MSKELIVLEENKKIVEFNSSFEVLKNGVIEKLKANEYNSIVTMENFPVMKKTMQELNGIAKTISDFRIAKVKEESKDLKQFEDNFKELAKFPKDKAEEIKKGLALFEEETKKEVLRVCKEYMLLFAKEKAWLREEFINKVNVSDMNLTGYMSATTKLINKKGRDEVEKRVNLQLSMQTKVDNRLLSLENECLKNEIEPLTQEHIQGFLFEDDAVYANKLNSLIQTEVKRNVAIKEKAEKEAKIKADAEAKEKVLKEQKEQKEKLESKYTSEIRNADIPTLTKINLELQAFDNAISYGLLQLSKQRQIELETPVVEEVQKIDESPQEQHLKDIAKEVPKEEIKTDKKTISSTPKAGMIKKRITVTFDIEVPKTYEDRVVDIYTDRFKENIKSVKNLKVVADDI